MNPQLVQPPDMTPTIREVNGKAVYFYNLQQVEYVRDKERRHDFNSRKSSPLLHSHSDRPTSAHKHTAYAC